MINNQITYVDRMVYQEFISKFCEKGVFSNFDLLPFKDQLIKDAKLKINQPELSYDETRKVLSEAKEYKTETHIIRDFGTHLYAFSYKVFIDSKAGSDENLNQSETINDALKKVSMGRLANKVVLYILSEVFKQKKTEDVKIFKKDLIETLGYSSEDKFLYSDIYTVIFSLRWLDYQVFEFKKRNGLKLKSWGTFIYDIQIEHDSYIISVNKKYIGCVFDLFNNPIEGKFKTGYIKYPMVAIRAAKEYSTAAYLLTNFLICENGNAKLNTEEEKVIAFSGGVLIKTIKINHKRLNKQKGGLIKALKELDFINKIEPSIPELEKLSSKDIKKTVIRIYLDKDVKKLSEKIESNLLGAKRV